MTSERRDPAAGRSTGNLARPRRRSHVASVLAGVVIIVAGFTVALVEAMHFPKGSIWAVVAVTAAIVGLIRVATRPR